VDELIVVVVRIRSTNRVPCSGPATLAAQKAPVEQDHLPAKRASQLAVPEPLPQSGFSGVVPLPHFSGMTAKLERVVKVLRAG